MTKKVKEVIHLLEINGWRLVRVRGDHRIYRKERCARPVVVPGKDSKDLAEGLYRSIIREAKL